MQNRAAITSQRLAVLAGHAGGARRSARRAVAARHRHHRLWVGQLQHLRPLDRLTIDPLAEGAQLDVELWIEFEYRSSKEQSEEGMSEVVYVSKSRIERKRGPLRIAHLPGESQPVVYSVHGAIAEHYKVDPAKLTESHAATIDYVISATAG